MRRATLDEDCLKPPSSPGTVTGWSAAAATRPPLERHVTADIPPDGAWQPVTAEPSGLVDLSRLFDPDRQPGIALGWLRTTLLEPTRTRRTLRIGWARQVCVFVNGRQVFSGNNPYYPEADRISPDGRLDPDNARVTVELGQGANTVVLAVGDGWRTSAGIDRPSPYGWGAELHVAASPEGEGMRRHGSAPSAQESWPVGGYGGQCRCGSANEAPGTSPSGG